jgi:Domain of unknown function (DUF4112)
VPTIRTSERIFPMPERDNTVSAALSRLDWLARIMDSAIAIPGSKVTIGFDAALGLIPVIGDIISSSIGAYIIWEAKQLGAPRLLLARMATNTTIDTVLGSVPLLGDVFDVVYKSNRKNVALLKAHIEKHGTGGERTISAEFTKA